MFDIGNILSIVLNTAFDIRDAIDAGRDRNLRDSIINLQLVATEDLSIDTVNSYCKALEVLYAMIIRSILTVQDRSRFSSNANSIFTSLPMLTPYDKVSFDKKLQSFISVRDGIFSKGESGSKALQTFAESFTAHLQDMNKDKSTISFEEVILKDATSAAPTFVDVTINVTQFGGKSVEKTFSIGLQVRPKIVSNQDMVQFLVKRNLSLVNNVDGQTKSFWARLKAKFSFNYRRAQNTSTKVGAKPADERTLENMMASVKSIKKPFVCLLMGNITRDMLKDMGIDITNAKLVQSIYAKLPVMSIAIYDSYKDTITSSLLRDTYFVEKTASEFTSEISQYEKQLSELVRVSKVFG